MGQFFLFRVWAQRTGKRPDLLRHPSQPNLRDEDVYKGGILDGHVCWSVRSSDAGWSTTYPPPGKCIFFALRVAD